jgi:hypothetical protein
VKPSYSGPRESDDNTYTKSLFRITEYRPKFPAKGSGALDAARQCGVAFVLWYNLEHKHSGIRYVSPQQHPIGEDHAILAARQALYTEPTQCNPARWKRHIHDWRTSGPVTLNPECDSIIDAR